MWRPAAAAAARRSAQIRRLLSSSAPSAGAGAAVPGPCIVHKRGTDILHDPWYNKVAIHPTPPHRPLPDLAIRASSDAISASISLAQDTAFPLTERDRLGLRGLLPPRVMSFEQQYERFSESPGPARFCRPSVVVFPYGPNSPMRPRDSPLIT